VRWTGIPTGTYSEDGQVNYAGKNWTVVKDNGTDVRMVLNGVSSSGKFADAGENLKPFISGNTVLNHDSDNDGLKKLSTGYYADSYSGKTIGYNGSSNPKNTTYSYWIGDGNFFNHKERSHKELTYDYYVTGFTHAAKTANLLSPQKKADGTKVVATTAVGVVYDSSNSNVSINSSGQAVFAKTGTTSYENSSWYWSQKGRRIVFDKKTSDCTATDSNKKLCWFSPNEYFDVNSSGEKIFSSSREHYYIDNDAQIQGKICGGDGTHGKKVRYHYNSSTTFYYGNEATGTGWAAWTDSSDMTVFDESKKNTCNLLSSNRWGC
jgi:hypothetical protein